MLQEETGDGQARQAEALYIEDAAILSFDEQGSELLAVTEQECLIYMYRGGS